MSCLVLQYLAEGSELVDFHSWHFSADCMSVFYIASM